MTDEQRDKGRVITLAILLSIMFLGMCSSCATQQYMNKVVVTHVLAVTSNGDTISVPIEQIQPQKIYNVIGYDFYRPYTNGYHRDWRFYYNDFRKENGMLNFNTVMKKVHPGYNNNNNTVQNSGVHTHGGAGNPVATNPVTQGGSSRGKNN